jgi:hypothetical protein
MLIKFGAYKSNKEGNLSPLKPKAFLLSSVLSFSLVLSFSSVLSCDILGYQYIDSGEFYKTKTSTPDLSMSDILCVCESKLDNTISDSAIFPSDSGYEIFTTYTTLVKENIA